MSYLKAYQAYTQSNYEQCLKLLQDSKQDDESIMDLRAQAHFQNKDYQKAYDIYKDLIGRGGPFQKEREDNLQTLICCAQLDKPDELKLKGKDKLPTKDDVIEQVELLKLNDDTVYDLFTKLKQSKRSKRPNKKRKIRLPKSYDPVAGPDPERWIARRDRKGNNQKKNKRRQRYQHKK